MPKPLKLIAGLLSLALAVPLLLLLIVDPNDYKEEIKTRVAAVTGRDLVLGGDLRLSVVPWVGLIATEVSLANTAAFGDGSFATLERVEARVSPVSLLAGRLEVKLLHLEGLHLGLFRDQHGRANWGDLTGGSTPAPEDPAKQDQAEEEEAPQPMPEVPPPPSGMRPPADRQPEAAPSLTPLPIGSIELVNSSVTWDDRQSGRQLSFEDLTLTAGPIAPGSPTKFGLTASVREGEAGTPVPLAMDGIVKGHESPGALELDPLRLRLEQVQAAAGLPVSLDLTTRLDADLPNRRYRLDDLQVRMTASGELLSDARLEALASARVDLDLNAGTLKVEQLAIRSDALQINGGAEGEGLRSAPIYSGQLAVEELDLRAWLREKGLPTPSSADAGTFSRLALKADWRLGGGRLALQDIDLVLDDSRVTGSAELVPSRPRGYRFDLAADRLDLDRYLAKADSDREPKPSKNPPVKAGDRQARDKETAPKETSGMATPPPIDREPPAPAPTNAEDRTQFPTEGLRDLDLEGRLRVGELKVARVTLGDAVFQIHAKGGELRIDDQVQRFYGGKTEGHVGLDVRTAEPSVAFVQRALGIRVGPLLMDRTGADPLTGTGDLNANLTATGGTEEALRRSLGGTLDVRLSNGTVKLFNLERIVLSAFNKQIGKRVPPQTKFTELRASATLQGGVLSNEDLDGKSDYLHVTGRGKVDIGKEGFDYRFLPVIVKPPSGGGIKELEGVPVPVGLTGSFDQPQWTVDTNQIQKRLEEKAGSFLEKLEDRTGIKGLKGLEKGLRGLFGR